VSINDHASTAAAAWAAWGGIGRSGYGRLHGVVGLREFAVPLHVQRNLLPRLKRLWWYPYDEATTSALRGVADLLSAPRWNERRDALRRIARSALIAIRAKI
jgi:hypothetical protein